jgi:hypothetical protein
MFFSFIYKLSNCPKTIGIYNLVPEQLCQLQVVRGFDKCQLRKKDQLIYKTSALVIQIFQVLYLGAIVNSGVCIIKQHLDPVVLV